MVCSQIKNTSKKNLHHCTTLFYINGQETKLPFFSLIKQCSNQTSPREVLNLHYTFLQKLVKRTLLNLSFDFRSLTVETRPEVLAFSWIWNNQMATCKNTSVHRKLKSPKTFSRGLGWCRSHCWDSCLPTAFPSPSPSCVPSVHQQPLSSVEALVFHW